MGCTCAGQEVLLGKFILYSDGMEAINLLLRGYEETHPFFILLLMRLLIHRDWNVRDYHVYREHIHRII